MKPEQREAMARALHRADVEPRIFDPHWNVMSFDGLSDEARAYWYRLADTALRTVREHEMRAYVARVMEG